MVYDFGLMGLFGAAVSKTLNRLDVRVMEGNTRAVLRLVRCTDYSSVIDVILMRCATLHRSCSRQD